MAHAPDVRRLDHSLAPLIQSAPDVGSGRRGAPRSAQPPAPEPPSRFGVWRRRLKVAALVLLGAVVFCLAAGAAGLYLVVDHFSEGLPSVETLKSGYNPPQVSRILAADGTQLSSVFTERRTVIPFSEIPGATKLAFLAADDTLRLWDRKALPEPRG